MSTWKSVKLIRSADLIENSADVECEWYYNTTSDYFNYTEHLIEEYHGYFSRPKGFEVSKHTSGVDESIRLASALMDWLSQYDEQAYLEIINNNMFKKEREKNSNGL